VLGGLRVTLLKDQIGIFHACLAQAFFGLLVFIAVARSRWWRERAAQARTRAGVANALRIAVATTVLIYLQLALGATMRHQHRDLAILDFPAAYGQIIPDTSAAALQRVNAWREAQALSTVDAGHIWLQMAHRFVAALISAGVIGYWWMLRRQRDAEGTLRNLSTVWFFFLACQVTLGAWTIWSNKAADIATAHVAVGATMLALGISIVAMTARLRSSAPELVMPRAHREHELAATGAA
jgi:cytochrome c oxidase assembly protein subunit 15